MKQAPIKHLGKVGLRRAKGMKQSAPIVCERAGGHWNGKYCEGATCEGWLPVRDMDGKIRAWIKCPGMASDTAHITSRAQGGDEDPSNLAALCRTCHNTLDHADHDTREQLRTKLQERIGGK